MKAHYPEQERTGYALTEYTKHFFVKDDEHPYDRDQALRLDPRLSRRRPLAAVGAAELSLERPRLRGQRASEGVGVDWPIRYADIAPWYDYVESFIGVSGQREGLPQLPDGQFLPPMEMNCVEKDLQASARRQVPRAPRHHRPRART